jgi:hypothetical protein
MRRWSTLRKGGRRIGQGLSTSSMHIKLPRAKAHEWRHNQGVPRPLGKAMMPRTSGILSATARPAVAGPSRDCRLPYWTRVEHSGRAWLSRPCRRQTILRFRTRHLLRRSLEPIELGMGRTRGVLPRRLPNCLAHPTTWNETRTTGK